MHCFINRTDEGITGMCCIVGLKTVNPEPGTKTLSCTIAQYRHQASHCFIMNCAGTWKWQPDPAFRCYCCKSSDNQIVGGSLIFPM